MLRPKQLAGSRELQAGPFNSTSTVCVVPVKRPITARWERVWDRQLVVSRDTVCLPASFYWGTEPRAYHTDFAEFLPRRSPRTLAGLLSTTIVRSSCMYHDSSCTTTIVAVLPLSYTRNRSFRSEKTTHTFHDGNSYPVPASSLGRPVAFPPCARSDPFPHGL